MNCQRSWRPTPAENTQQTGAKVIVNDHSRWNASTSINCILKNESDVDHFLLLFQTPPVCGRTTRRTDRMTTRKTKAWQGSCCLISSPRTNMVRRCLLLCSSSYWKSCHNILRKKRQKCLEEVWTVFNRWRLLRGRWRRRSRRFERPHLSDRFTGNGF